MQPLLSGSYPDFPKHQNLMLIVISSEEFKKYFTNVVPNLASKIQNTSKTFEDFLFPIQKIMEYKDLTLKNLKKLLSQYNRIRLSDTTVLTATS